MICIDKLQKALANFLEIDLTTLPKIESILESKGYTAIQKGDEIKYLNNANFEKQAESSAPQVQEITDKQKFLEDYPLSSHATPIPPKVNVDEFLNSLENVKNKENFINHLKGKEDAQARLSYLNLVEPTLKEWNIKLTQGDKEIFIKPFYYFTKDNQKEIFYLLSTKEKGQTLLTGLPTSKESYIKKQIQDSDKVEIRQRAISDLDTATKERIANLQDNSTTPMAKNQESQKKTLSPLQKALKEKSDAIAKEQEALAKREAEIKQRIDEYEAEKQRIHDEKKALAGLSVNERALTKGEPIPAQDLEMPQTYININESQNIPLKFVKVKASDVKPNFTGNELQPRTEKNLLAIESIAGRNPSNPFDPKRIIGNGGFKDLPIITQDGSVIIGNHRAQGFKEFTSEARAAYNQAIKDHFNVNLADDELILRMPAKELSDKEMIDLAFASNFETTQNLGDKILASLGKYSKNIDNLKQRFFSSESLSELETKIAHALEPANNYPDKEATSMALFASLAKNSNNRTIANTLNETLKHLDLQQSDKLKDMYIKNAGSFYNIVNDTDLARLELRPYLLDALNGTAQALKTSRAENFRRLIENINDILHTTDANGSNALKQMANENIYQDTISDILGASLARFARLENPATSLYEALKGTKDALKEALEPTLIKEGKPLKEADIYDFLELMIKQGEPSKESSQLIDLLPKLKEKEQAYNAFTKGEVPEIKAEPQVLKAETPEIKPEVQAETPALKEATPEVKAEPSTLKASEPEAKMETPAPEVKPTEPESKSLFEAEPSAVKETPEVKAEPQEITFIDESGQEQVIKKELVDKWLETFNLKSIDDDFIPSLPSEISGLFDSGIHLKIGSLVKLHNRNRLDFLDKIRPTLESPDALVKQKDGAYIFVKDFNNEKYFSSVTRNDNGEWIVTSNAPKTVNNLQNKLKEGGEVVFSNLPELPIIAKSELPVKALNDKGDIKAGSQINASTPYDDIANSNIKLDSNSTTPTLKNQEATQEILAKSKDYNEIEDLMRKIKELENSDMPFEKKQKQMKKLENQRQRKVLELKANNPEIYDLAVKKEASEIYQQVKDKRHIGIMGTQFYPPDVWAQVDYLKRREALRTNKNITDATNRLLEKYESELESTLKKLPNLKKPITTLKKLDRKIQKISRFTGVRGIENASHRVLALSDSIDLALKDLLAKVPNSSPKSPQAKILTSSKTQDFLDFTKTKKDEIDYLLQVKPDDLEKYFKSELANTKDAHKQRFLQRMQAQTPALKEATPEVKPTEPESKSLFESEPSAVKASEPEASTLKQAEPESQALKAETPEVKPTKPKSKNLFKSEPSAVKASEPEASTLKQAEPESQALKAETPEVKAEQINPRSAKAKKMLQGKIIDLLEQGKINEAESKLIQIVEEHPFLDNKAFLSPIHEKYQEVLARQKATPKAQESTNPKTLQTNAHIGSGLISGSVAGVETDESGNITGFSPEKFALGFLGGSLASKIGLDTIKRLSKNPKAREVLERIKTKNDNIMPMKREKETLKKYNVENLQLATKEQYKDFIDKALQKDYRKMPNILKIANINNDLQNALGLGKSEVFLTKKHLGHFRKDRKEAFKQDLPNEFLYKIPEIIKDAKKAYMDTKNNNFFIVESLDDRHMAFLHFNTDELGNFIVTAKKGEKSILNKKEYIEVKS